MKMSFVNKPKVGMISLGCAKNLVDAESMLGSVLQRGIEITSRAEDADVLVVNTCAFIDSAKEESIGAILEAHQQRGLNKNSGQKLIVSGCMSQRFARELREEMPEVDAFIGLDQVGQLGEIVEKILKKRATLNAGSSMWGVDSDSVDADLAFANARPTYIPDYDTPRFRLTPAHSAYVKIAEGCNHPCSFCVIPQMRGKHRSRTPQSVLAEIRMLVSEGVREINLISQDTTYYGMDLWTAKAGPRQPVDSTRGPTLAALLREIQEIDEEFSSLIDVIRRTRFERLGIFKYSREEGSRAAKMSGQVPLKTKNTRYRMAMSIQREIAHETEREKIGRTLKLLVDQPHVARSEADAPDVDARVILSKTAPVGEFVWLPIVGSRGYDLLA